MDDYTSLDQWQDCSLFSRHIVEGCKGEKTMKREKLLKDFQDEAFKTGDMTQYLDLCRLESVLDYMDDDQFIHYLGHIHYKGC